MEAVFIHADESALGNQFQDRARPGGAGGLVEVWKEDRWERRDYWVSEPDTTNNRMAIRSAIEPLRALTRSCRVRLVSDSQYLVNGMKSWMAAWKRQGWRRKGGTVENLELWQELDRQMARHEIRVEWVRGHARHVENDYCDFLATRAAKEQTTSGGLIPSGFEEWLERQRAKGTYTDYDASRGPAERFP